MATRVLLRTLRSSANQTLIPRSFTTSSYFLRFGPAAVIAAANFHQVSLAARTFSTRPATSSLNDSNPNWSNRPPKETILLDGCDFEHWLVVVEKPEGEPTRDEIIESYINTLAKVVGSYDEARMKIYSVSTRCYYAFGALVSEELSYKLKELPGVRWVLPDSYLDVKNKDYGGEPFIDGKAVPYDPKYHEEWIRNNARANERNRRNDRPRNSDRSRNFERRRENMQSNRGPPNNMDGPPSNMRPQGPPPPSNNSGPQGPPPPSYNSGPQGPPPPSYNSGPQVPSPPSYNSGPQGPSPPSYNSGPQSPSPASYNSGPQSPSPPSYNSGPQGPPPPSYNSGPQSPSPPSYNSGPQSPSPPSYNSGPQGPPPPSYNGGPQGPLPPPYNGGPQGSPPPYNGGPPNMRYQNSGWTPNNGPNYQQQPQGPNSGRTGYQQSGPGPNSYSPNSNPYLSQDVPGRDLPSAVNYE